MTEGLVVPMPQIPQMQQEDFLQEVANAEDKVLDTGKQPMVTDDPNDDGKQGSKRRKRGKNQDTEARKESHKLIEQKRRQRINEKIGELRELLNYPDGSQNKSVVLQAAVENIRYLKMACSRMLQHYRQMAEEHSQLVNENERLRKMLEQQGIKVTPDNATTSAQDADKSNGDPAKKNLGLEFGNFFGSPDESAHALSVLSSSLSVTPLARGNNSAIQMIPNAMPQLGLSGPTYGAPNPFANPTVQEAIVVTAATNGTGVNGANSVPAPALTSTETENGVTITRLTTSEY